jgi:hypothetical protein
MKAITIFNTGAPQATGTVNKNFDLPDDAKGAVFVLDITAKTGTLTHDVKIQYYDELSGKFIDVPGAAFAQKSATGTSQLSVYPGLTASANVAVTQVLTKTLRAVSTVGGSSSPDSTFTLTAHPIA